MQSIEACSGSPNLSFFENILNFWSRGLGRINLFWLVFIIFLELYCSSSEIWEISIKQVNSTSIVLISFQNYKYLTNMTSMPQFSTYHHPRKVKLSSFPKFIPACVVSISFPTADKACSGRPISLCDVYLWWLKTCSSGKQLEQDHTAAD